MESVGAYEAKTHLAELLGRVAAGERITILKHGVPIAVMQPPEPRKSTPAREVIVQIRQFRSGRRLDGIKLREMIEEGRR